MKILITGNMGYVGPGVISELRAFYPKATLIGYDMGYFASCLTHAATLPEYLLDAQIFGDVRTIAPAVLEGIDVVIYLAAISNDAMGNRYEHVTLGVNYQAAVRTAQLAKEAGARAFVFASSCSIYGFADSMPRTEYASLNPLTAYAKSKVMAEKSLEPLAGRGFKITCLRFATACGMSPRLRLDLVLNDFVAGAVSSSTINILSDGTPWRPLIHVKDMARAIRWATGGIADRENDFLAVNVGSNAWNYQVRDLARAVAEVIPGTTVMVNENAAQDKRSYSVNFDLFEKLAPDAQPVYTLTETIEELYRGLIAMGFNNTDFRNSRYMRLKLLSMLQEDSQLSEQLQWRRKETSSAEFRQNLITA